METDFATREVSEGLANIIVPDVVMRRGPGVRSALPFYNPTMSIARDLSVLVAGAIVPGGRPVLDGLAATGVLGLRIALESGNGLRVTLNDRNPRAVVLMHENSGRNSLAQATIVSEDLNAHLATHNYALVEIDPFGSPVPFLDVALRSGHRGSVIAVTATDTPVLCGSRPEPCHRRYLARVRRTDAYAEIGVRTLLGFIARMAGRFDRAVEPLLAYGAEHFIRVYVRISEGAARADRSLAHLGWVVFDAATGRFEATGLPGGNGIGPLWLGPLMDRGLVANLEAKPYMASATARLVDLLRGEVDLPPFYYESNATAGRLGISPPRFATLLGWLRDRGFQAVPTHFRANAFKTDAPWEEVRRVYESCR